MHEIEWRDWVRQYLGGLEVQIAALRSSETRVAALEGKWREADARRRSAVGGRGNKPIGVVPKAEVGRLSVSPRCARLADRWPDRFCWHSGRRRLRAIGLRGAQARPQDRA
jgi:hypothetical protein